MNFPQKVLLIDDDYEEYEILATALNECCQGVELIYEKNANFALTRMANDDINSIPDMVILDWRMPKVSGRDVLTSIRKLTHYTQVPIVIFTGILAPAHLEEAKILGATFFLQKPFDFAELHRKLIHLFSLDWRDTKSPGQLI
jgi:DNA-binding response OmpR family regulator